VGCEVDYLGAAMRSAAAREELSRPVDMNSSQDSTKLLEQAERSETPDVLYFRRFYAANDVASNADVVCDLAKQFLALVEK